MTPFIEMRIVVPFLVTAVVLIGAICALDLILTLGVIKRLRSHSEILSNRNNEGPPAMEVGEEVGRFETSTLDDVRITWEGTREGTIVAFFSPTCAPCKAKLPNFLEHSRTLRAGDPRPVAVVVGDSADADEFLSALRPVADVVLENHEGVMAKAFQVTAFPTVLMVAPDASGVLRVTDNNVALSRTAPRAA
ncbi:hypothetical protein ACQP1K_27350 [Sphaerimonospora sp. CA-214678]|uniref:hypothetical protein n=1 Tax=Sphaerimonospora sp. CA-214678 TaxID=3240029 RepID=UPI003D8A8F97